MHYNLTGIYITFATFISWHLVLLTLDMRIV